MNGKQFGMGVMYGVSTNLIAILAFGMIFGLLLRFTSISEDSLAWVFRILSFIIVLLGGFVSGIVSQHKGYLAGMITAVVFSLFIFSSQYLGFDQGFSTQQWMNHGGFVVASMLGGVFGSNLARSDR